jgi:2',3'-cyclic-nucleotide 2'-phosphodiesterase (5'-nucleotidase family)
MFIITICNKYILVDCCEIKILHTGGIHSRFKNFSRATTKLREFKDENAMVLDAGDFNDFMSIKLQGTNEIALDIMKLYMG